jgi:diguanylate cyclase (GGDEF)-like protein
VAGSNVRAERLDALVPVGWDDPLTGSQGPLFWSLVLATELARARRYRRPLTVVLVELAGASELASTWGWDVAREVIGDLGRCLRRSVRTSDHIARIEAFRFGLLLTETGEVPAINLIERVRDACPSALPERVRGTIHLAFGWTSPSGDDTSDAVLGRAMAILAAELRG